MTVYLYILSRFALYHVNTTEWSIWSFWLGQTAEGWGGRGLYRRAQSKVFCDNQAVTWLCQVTIKQVWLRLQLRQIQVRHCSLLPAPSQCEPVEPSRQRRASSSRGIASQLSSSGRRPLVSRGVGCCPSSKDWLPGAHFKTTSVVYL